MKKILFLMAVLLMAFTASAKTWNITDSTCFEGKRSSCNLYVTLERSNGAQNGDTIVLADGEYIETISLPLNKSVYIKAAPNANPVIKMSGYFQMRASLRLEGIKFKFVGSEGNGYCVYFYENSHKYVMAENCQFEDFTQYAFSSWEKYHIDSCIVNNCQFRNCKKASFYFAASTLSNDTNACDYLKVTNSTFYNIGLNEVAVIDLRNNNNSTAATSKLVVDHCTFYKCQGYERLIQSYKSPDVHITNCIMMNPLVNGEVANPYATYVYGSSAVVDHNLNFQTKKQYISGGTVTNKIELNPLFVDTATADFHFVTGSPAIGAGSDGSTLGDPRWATVAPATHSVYFVNTSDWATPKAYAWTKDKGINGVWPGTAMVSTNRKYNGKTVYKLFINTLRDSVIFSNNGSSQTENLAWGAGSNDGKMYVPGTGWMDLTYDDVTISVVGAADGGELGGQPDALFTSTWDPTIYANDMTYDPDLNMMVWTKENVNIAAGTIKYKVVSDHNWGTGDFPASGNYDYVVNKTGRYHVTIKYDLASNLSMELVDNTPEVALEADITRIYAGAGDEITLTATPTHFNQAVTTYAYSYKKEGDADFTNIDGSAASKTIAAPAVAGNYTYKVVASNASEQAEATIDVEVVSSWTVAGALNDVSLADQDDALFGKTWKGDAVANDMINQGTVFTWTKTVYVAASTALDFKIVKNHNTYAYPVSNYEKTLAVGYNKITVTFNWNTETIECDVVNYPKVEFKASFHNDWEEVEMATAGDLSYCSITYPLTAITHTKSFMISVNGGTWYGYNNTLTRTDNVNWTLDDSKNPCSIKADVAGNYTFKFDFSDNKVDVDYPESFTRSGANYQSLCVPFDAEITNAKVFRLGTHDAGVVVLEDIDADDLTKGKSYIIRAIDPAQEMVISKRDGGGSVSAPVDDDYHKGILGETRVANDTYNCYVLMSNELRLIGSGATVNIESTKAFFYLPPSATPTPSPSAVRIVEAANNTTAIDNIEAKDEVVKFFENGILFIRRNGVTYDVTGRAVK